MALPLTAWIAREMQLIAVLGSPLLAVLGAFATPSRARTAAADAIRSPGCLCWSPLAHRRPGEVCVLRSVGAVGTFVLGLHEKRKKVHHPGLQHVGNG